MNVLNICFSNVCEKPFQLILFLKYSIIKMKGHSIQNY